MPYGASLAYLAMKRRAGDQEYQGQYMRFQLQEDVRYAEPSMEALTLMTLHTCLYITLHYITLHYITLHDMT